MIARPTVSFRRCPTRGHTFVSTGSARASLKRALRVEQPFRKSHIGLAGRSADRDGDRDGAAGRHRIRDQNVHLHQAGGGVGRFAAVLFAVAATPPTFAVQFRFTEGSGVPEIRPSTPGGVVGPSPVP